MLCQAFAEVAHSLRCFTSSVYCHTFVHSNNTEV